MSKVDVHHGLSHVNDSGLHRPGVMARLHALFPSTPTHEAPPPLPPKSMDTRKARPAPKSIKVRILTWNMHESLPKGELDELLGQVLPSYPSYPQSESNSLPEFPPDETHPYHLVVVAGQECPTISGLPRGLGAPGFQLRDREKKEKEKHKDRERDDEADYAPLLHSKSEVTDREKEFEGRTRPRSLHRLHLHRDNSQKVVERDLVSISSDGTPHDHNHTQYGWSSMLEEWYTHANAPHTNHTSTSLSNDVLSPKPTLLNVPVADERDHRSEEVVLSPKAQSTGDLNARMSIAASDRGPYELLIKERMMGLYLAIFVHRDVRPLVEGTSKSAVTAGLIGGRLGNKGGVGVSVKVAGTTLLFINAHLAAHEGKVHHRLANLAKIKSELAVNDFLPSDDPRIMSEDLTDKFDYSFILGDLNFRLDITRLHADWLLSRRDYAQAFAFDQLRREMQEGQAFTGFHEAPIDFPPTFKYDVQRSNKRSRLRSMKRSSKVPGTPDTPHDKMLTEIEEKEKEEQEEDEEDYGDGNDAASLTSSMWTSVTSRYTGANGDNGEDKYPDPDEAEFYSYTNATAAATKANMNPGSAMHKVWAATAAHKAKAKFVALINSSSTAGGPGKLMKMRKKSDPTYEGETQPLSPSFQATTFPPTPGQSTPGSPAMDDDKYLKPTRSLASSAGELAKAVVRSGSPKSRKSEEEEVDEGVGVYDTSHKKRVPSWCDRILWKSTIVPEPEEDEEEESSAPPTLPIPPRIRFGNFFHAFRPRGRRDSQMSLSSSLTSPETSDNEGEPASPRVTHAPSPLSQARQPPRRLLNSKSTDALPKYNNQPLDRIQSHHHTPTTENIPSRSRKPSLPTLTTDPFDTSSTKPDTSFTRDRLTLSDNTVPSSAISDTPPPVPPKDPHTSKWSRFPFIPPFLSRDSPRPLVKEPEPLPPQDPAPPAKPRRGDVVCLGYHTLDDKGMKRLMGRSDHRPVIGSYTLYI